MKKFLLLFVMVLAFSGFSLAQMVCDFEVIKMNIMYGGNNDSSSMIVVPNPDPTGINTSKWVVKFTRDKDGVPWGGFFSPTAVDVTTNKYVHVKVWKPRISPIKFKIEKPGEGHEIFSINPQTLTNAWEEIVFDFSAYTGTWPTIVFMPDFLEPVGLTEDIIIYFDDITINNDPLPGSTPAEIIEDYEVIPLNVMMGGPTDLSTMTVVPNPDPTGINQSNYVVNFLRDKDGVPWGGFWSPTAVDVTTNKFVHVKVWKPRISPLKFKIEKPGEGHEIFSINPQTKTGAWEDIVWDFSAYTDVWPTIVFMPDFEDPLTLTEDITIFFDDILLSTEAFAVGTGKDLLANNIIVYPVPFNNYLVVNTAVDLNYITLISVVGKQVIKMENLGAGTTTINTAELPAGLYFVTLSGKAGGLVTQKLVKR